MPEHSGDGEETGSMMLFEIRINVIFCAEPVGQVTLFDRHEILVFLVPADEPVPEVVHVENVRVDGNGDQRQQLKL